MAFRPVDPMIYEVHTDLDPEQLTEAGMDIFKQWVDFALGGSSLGGKRILHPTGRYASSISFRRYGASRVAIIADERIAPEAAILETGHVAVDLKKKLIPGATYPMHRGTMAPPHLGRRGKKMWAQVRESGASGFATVPSDPRGHELDWIIPPMAAYEPGRLLAELAAAQAGVAIA